MSDAHQTTRLIPSHGCTPCQLAGLAVSSYAIAWLVIFAVILLAWLSFPTPPPLELPTSNVLFPAVVIFWLRLCRAERKRPVQQKASIP